MLSRPCGPLTRAPYRSSHVSQPTQTLDSDDDGNWSTDSGYDGRHSAQQPSMSRGRRLSMGSASTSHRSAWESYGRQGASPRGYRSSIGPEGVGGQAVRWTQPRARIPVDPPPDPQLEQPPPVPPRHLHEPISLRRQPSHVRCSPAVNPFVSTGPIYTPPEDPAHDCRLAQRLQPHTLFDSLQPQPANSARRRTETEPVREQRGQASRQSQWRRIPDHEHRPQRQKPNPQRSEGDKVRKQEEITRMIREEMAALLDEKLSQPRGNQQHRGNMTVRNPSSVNNDSASTVAQLIIGLLQGNSNGFGDKPAPTSSCTFMQGPTYDRAVAYIATSMQRNQLLFPAHQTQSPGPPAPGLDSGEANGHLDHPELIRCLINQLLGIVHDLQKELQSFDGGSSTRSSQYSPPQGRSAAEADLESLAPLPSSRSAKSARTSLSVNRKQGVDLFKEVPRSRQPHAEGQDDSSFSKESSEDDYRACDIPAKPRPSIAHRQQRGFVFDVDRGPKLHQMQTNKSRVRYGANSSAPRAPAQSRYARPYVEDQEESMNDEECDMSDGEAVQLDYDHSGPLRSYVAAKGLNRPVALATQPTRASTLRTHGKRGLRTDITGGDWDDDCSEDDHQYIPPPPRQQGLYALNLQTAESRAQPRGSSAFFVPRERVPSHAPSVFSQDV